MLEFLQFWGFLWPWKLTLIGHWINFNSPVLFPWWLKQAVFFLPDASAFPTIDEKKEEQKSTLQIFFKDVTEGKIVEINKHN